MEEIGCGKDVLAQALGTVDQVEGLARRRVRVEGCRGDHRGHHLVDRVVTEGGPRAPETGWRQPSRWPVPDPGHPLNGRRRSLPGHEELTIERQRSPTRIRCRHARRLVAD